MRGSIRHHALRGGLAVATSAALLVAFTGLSAAAPPSGHGRSDRRADNHAVESRPGWGCGDRNHEHTGPAGGGASPCGARDENSSDDGQQGEEAAQAALHLTVSAPASAVPGTAFNFTVTAVRHFRTVRSFADTIHFTSSDATASLPADSTLTNGAGSFSATLHTTGNQTITATDTANGSIVGTSGAIAVAVAAAPHFVVSAPASTTAGSQFNVTVTALDQNNNTITTFGDAVHFTSSDGNAVLPANATLTNGTGTFVAALRTAGNQTITATDASDSSMTGTSGTIAVSAAAATHLAVSAPATATNGTAFSFTATAEDQYNNTASAYAGTVHFTSTDGSATLPADATLTQGVGTFSATLHTVGNQTISATDTATASITGTSQAITVS